MQDDRRKELPFRVFDSREKYLLFANTCSEGREAARRIGREFDAMTPRPPALRLYKVGAGEGSVLNLTLRHLHRRWPSVPLVVVVREDDFDFIRLSLRSLVDRFREHPELVVVFTNLPYRAAGLSGDGDAAAWRAVPLEGTSSYGFEAQMREAIASLDAPWSGDGSAGGAPGCLVFYRADHAFALDRVIPRPEGPPLAYDLMIAIQPYHGRLPAADKAGAVLAPLAGQLAPGGRLVVIQARGGDPGLEIVRSIWPDEQPFPTPRHELMEALAAELEHGAAGRYELIEPSDGTAEFRYVLQLNPDELQSAIGTSTLLAGWNAATYVAEIDETRLTEAMCRADYLDATRRVLRQHQGLWFVDECFVVARRDGPEAARSAA